MDHTDILNAPLDGPTDENTIPVFAGRFGSWRVSLERFAMSTSDLGRRYDRAAPAWGQTLDRLGVPDAYEMMLRNMLHAAPPDGTGGPPRVLDCGVGTGALSCALARVWSAPFTLDAIDISPRMLRTARRTLCHGSRDVRLRQGDVRNLPYHDGAFDIVMAAHLLEHLPDPVEGLNEMVRVLKPGGFLIICLTRRSALGAYVHLKWRTHRVMPDVAERWLLGSGLEDICCWSFDQHALYNRLGFACGGRKPGMEIHAGIAA